MTKSEIYIDNFDDFTRLTTRCNRDDVLHNPRFVTYPASPIKGCAIAEIRPSIAIRARLRLYRPLTNSQLLLPSLATSEATSRARPNYKVAIG